MKDPVHVATDPFRVADRIRCDCCTTCRWAGNGCVAGGPYLGYTEPRNPVNRGSLLCAVCGAPTERTQHIFPQRPAPHNRPYEAAVYHRDPFLLGGALENYCGSACAAKVFKERT